MYVYLNLLSSRMSSSLMLQVILMDSDKILGLHNYTHANMFQNEQLVTPITSILADTFNIYY